jgi:hypothetical protein
MDAAHLCAALGVHDVSILSRLERQCSVGPCRGRGELPDKTLQGRSREANFRLASRLLEFFCPTGAKENSHGNHRLRGRRNTTVRDPDCS